MFIISNRILDVRPTLKLPNDTIIRINLAWVKDYVQMEDFIKRSQYPIFLDYPCGRTKPPQPKLSLTEAINYANKCSDKVKYFAVSNAESESFIIKLKQRLKLGITIVPKIETVEGVARLEYLVRDNTDLVMLDKEDLYWDCGRRDEQYNQCIKIVREKCKALKAKLIIIQGVIFLED